MRLYAPTKIATSRAILTARSRRSLTHGAGALSAAPFPEPIATTSNNHHGSQLRRLYSSEKGTTPPSPPPPSSSSSTTFNPQTYLNQATTTLSAIPPKLIPDTLHPTQSHLLSVALSSYLPSICLPPGFNLNLNSPNSHQKSSPFPWPTKSSYQEEAALPPGYHLAYYPLQTAPHLLFPDGTDADHCPGAPFTRRMWAGGRIEFLLPDNTQQEEPTPAVVDGRKTLCVETLGVPPTVQVGKDGGKAEEQRVWVDIYRKYITFSPETTDQEIEKVVEEVVRESNIQAGRTTTTTTSNSEEEPEKEKEQTEGVIINELRRLVFLREREPGSKLEPPRIIRVPHKPDFSFTMTPDATLLFQFSALTFNAHAIHLDPEYAREVEGYKERLVHGPLTLVIMLRAVEGFLRAASASGGGGGGGGGGADGTKVSEEIKERLSVGKGEPKQNKWEIANIEYKNLRPLFVGEEMKVCVRLLPNKQKHGDEAGLEGHKERIDVWIEAPDEGLAVKGTVGVELR
ncbi:hypothetical protein B0T20DRAFT_451759 [Sordaria brevicollis]|uniref:Uncharacterized protein n=1 Tax=Sordaria brevicollis TaxID=83679 RepID=A0AAE0UET2_SORBR|nr:hypothetical protein B0T20DRAFT_451759 [Sordaria brevicollis]